MALLYRIDTKAKRLLQPIVTTYEGYADVPEKTPGVIIEPFTISGWDHKPLQACIVRRAENSSDLTPRQHALLDKLPELPQLGDVDYVLVCAEWDHGIRTALPLAEELAAAGLTCVLWEPRGSNSERSWCTYGLYESRDVACLIDALEKRAGHGNLLVVGVGQGYGADLMLQAAATEPRLRATVATDADASLTKLLKRSGLSTPMRELIGWRMCQLTGLEPFDVAPVKSAGLIPREVPVLLVHSSDDAGAAQDAVAIFSQLKSDFGRLITPRIKSDAPDATVRTVVYTTEGGTHEVQQKLEIELVDDADSLTVEMLRWLNNCIPALQETPLPPSPTSPTTR